MSAQLSQRCPSSSVSIYQKATRLALAQGLAPDQLAGHQQHPEIREGAPYLPIDLLLETYELADVHLPGGFGVRQGRQLHAEDYGTLGLSWRTCWRARDVLHRTARYMVLVTDDGQARVIEQDHHITLYLDRDARRKGLEIANEASLVMLVGVLREGTGQDIHPVWVSFKHHNQATQAFAEYFQCPVRFGRRAYALQFRTVDLEQPTLKADRSIHQFLVERMEEEEKAIHTRANRLLSEIHQLVSEALPSGIPSLIQIAIT